MIDKMVELAKKRSVPLFGTFELEIGQQQAREGLECGLLVYGKDGVLTLNEDFMDAADG